MKKLLTFIFLFFLVFSILLENACTKTNRANQTEATETTTQPLTIPSPEDFSSTELLQFDGQFPQVKRAVLYRDGKQTELAENDPGLIRLLNFCANSVRENSIGYLQGVLTDEASVPLKKEPRLEIEFTGDIDESALPLDFSGYDRAVFFGRDVFLKQSHPTYRPDQIWYSITPYFQYATQTEDFNLLQAGGLI